MSKSNLDKLFDHQYIFFDIETVPKVKTFEELSELEQTTWTKLTNKQSTFKKDREDGLTVSEIFSKWAGLFPEFNKVVAIAIGRKIDDENVIRVITENDGGEYDIIRTFAEICIKRPDDYLVGYNCINFDCDVLLKRMISLGIHVPKQINTRAFKPWLLPVKDIFLFWKGTRYDYHPSLELVSAYLGCGTPKDNMSGDQVADYYYNVSSEKEKHKNIALIGDYCKEDVDVTMCVFEKLHDMGMM